MWRILDPFHFVVVPSAIGSRVLFQRGMDPAVEGTVIHRSDDIRKL
jgi:hypothetical protein